VTAHARSPLISGSAELGGQTPFRSVPSLLLTEPFLTSTLTALHIGLDRGENGVPSLLSFRFLVLLQRPAAQRASELACPSWTACPV
jgi:hypothetical protein